MTIEEAYNVLLQAWQGNKEAKDYPNFDDINEALYIIKQALERLEQLEQENQELKEQRLSLSLQLQDYKLIKEITLPNVLEENEKRKKAIEFLVAFAGISVGYDDDILIERLGDISLKSLDLEDQIAIKEVLDNAK